MPPRVAAFGNPLDAMNLRREQAAKLGELLATRGKLDREVLLRALRHQRSAGGRLGTCLLEIDAVVEDDLLAVLSDQLKVPFLSAEDLRAIPADAVRLVPAKTAAKLCAVPVRASASQLVIAMRDPLDLAGLDELAFVSGRRIRAHVALEARIYEALARFYRVDTPSRFVQLADRLNRAQFLWNEGDGDSAGASAEHPPTPRQRAVEPVPTASATPSPYPPLPSRPGDRPAPPPLPHMPQPVEPPPPPRPAPVAPPETKPALTFDAAEARLLSPSDRDAVADTLIEFLAGRADVGLMLMIRRDEAAGWRGCGLPHEVAAAVRLPVTEPSVVLALRDGAPLHRGPLPPLRGNATLVAAVGADVCDLLALPLRVRERLVGVVFAINRRAALDAGLVDDLQRLAVKASGALELLVLRQKLRQA